MQLPYILHGGDYNPEQWLNRPDILKKDLEFMKEAGINTVTLGVFSWSVLEPEEDTYQFDWLEKIINGLYQNGISTILATPSGARPKWMSDKYPEVLRISEDRRRNLFGGRENHCFTSPVFREKTAEINRRLAERFAKNPAVIMWHISNEYNGECHCAYCQEAFREWLKKRYGSIEDINDKWCTTFWSHRYQSFDQIESPSSIGETALHGLTLDWNRFVSDQTADFIEAEIKALRAGGATQPTTINLMYDFKQLNYGRLAECVDIISWDSYPVWHKNNDLVVALNNAMQHDYMRSLKHKPFLMMECCPSSTNWHGVSKLKRPGILSAASLQAIAHGADAAMYFQIRQSRGSSEKFHGAVIDHYGEKDTRVFREICSLGKKLEALTPVVGSEVVSEVAVIYDTENRWAMEDAQGPRNDGLFYHEHTLKTYLALKSRGLNVDMITQDRNYEKYKLVIAPMLYLFHPDTADKIRKFVERGGCFVMTPWSGIVDENDRCFLGGTPYGLMDVFGLRRTETDALYDHESNTLIQNKQDDVTATYFRSSYTCSLLCDLLETTTASAFFTYGKEFYQGTPAVTRNQYGKGTAYYVGTDASQEFFEDFYSFIMEEYRISSVIRGNVPEGVAVSARKNEHSEFTFVQNYKNEPVDIKIMRLKGDILIGGSMSKLEAYESLVVQTKA